MSFRRRPQPPLPYTPRPAAPGEPVAPTESVTRQLRGLYAAPEDAGYWEGLEARILAAVRDGAAATTGAMRAVPAAAVDWWQALARWARPACAAAAVTLALTGAALAGLRIADDASRARTAFRTVLGTPGGDAALPLPAPDPQLARLVDAYEPDPNDPAGVAEARAARLASELLSNGLVRRAPEDVARDARREATLRYVLPER